MADSPPPKRRSEQATRPLIYDLGDATVGGGKGDAGGARVGEFVGRTSGAGVGAAIGAGVAAGSLPRQADTTKISPAIVRNTVDDRLLIGGSIESDCISWLSKACGQATAESQA